MADTHAASRRTPTNHASRRCPPSMSCTQLQAYFLARDTLRRLKPASTPLVPPDVTLRGPARPTL
jgi:hypothetical protein